MASRGYPLPEPGETVLEYAERLNSDEIDEGSFVPLVEQFGLSVSAAKAIWLASENFNTRFAYEQWSSRLVRSPDGYGACNWLKRKYRLSDAVAKEVDGEFREGNRRALADKLGFDGFAKALLTDDARTSLVSLGLVRPDPDKKERIA